MKGIPDIYEETCRDLSENSQEGFTEWRRGTDFVQGQFAFAMVWYEKRYTWYLEEHKYNPYNESMSTWYAYKLKGHPPPKPDSYVMKYFEIEKDEQLITTNSKQRPVILLRKAISDWWNTSNTAMHETYWLCVPLFTYKERHNQNYVLNDQRLDNINAFYIPTGSSKYPGISNVECVARFQAIQMIKKQRLKPCKCMCQAEGMNLPFRLSNLGLRLIIYHFYKSLGVLPELENTETEYDLFKEQIGKLIDAALQ